MDGWFGQAVLVVDGRDEGLGWLSFSGIAGRRWTKKDE